MHVLEYSNNTKEILMKSHPFPAPVYPFQGCPMLVLCVLSGVPGPVLPSRGATSQMWQLTVGTVTSTN